MKKHIENDLLHIHDRWVKTFMDDSPIDHIDEFVAQDIMGYGTTMEERIFGIEHVKELCLVGKEQMKQFTDYSYDLDIVKKQFSSDKKSAVIVAEIKLSYTHNNVKADIPLRISTIFFDDNNQWKIVHWHGSTPVETKEGDSWHTEEWQLKNEKLQQLVDQRTAELKETIVNLKAAQAQLIHAEKMASLGELTAGIAHEIQNPLNFVNNFSEVSNELLDEMNEELEQGAYDEAKMIASDIKQNLEKITHHGKRADSIVKGMLQHSRKSTGEKEHVDLNQLIDEYLRLAYHGLRAKDKSFNAHLETHFDDTIDSISIIPQDMGRVILNLITNAFYAVSEKHNELKTSNHEYHPTVSIQTKQEKNAVEIYIKDNGNGIPKKIVDKIFQPFFTTKPTGSGTGLGLSMSYDIIKAHNGQLTVESEEGQQTVFKIVLPKHN